MFLYEELTRRREAAGLSKTEAAKRGDFSPQQWNNIEAGRRPNLSAETLFRVARAVGCKMEDLIRADPPAKGKGKGK